MQCLARKILASQITMPTQQGVANMMRSAWEKYFRDENITIEIAMINELYNGR